MLERVGNQVVNLHRIRMANLLLGNLKMGHWRYVTEKEIKALLKSCNIVSLKLQKHIP